MNALKEILYNHPAFKILGPEYINYLCECARKETFKPDTFIFKTGEPADEFYLIDSGKITLQVYSPPKGPLNILTLTSHDLLGWSWLYPPYTWHFEARAVTETATYTFDAVRVREKCQEDFEFGYLFSSCFGKVMMQRLAATRLQLLDIYGSDIGSYNYHE